MIVLRGVVYKMKKKRSENRSLRNTIEKLKKRRLGVFNVDIDGTTKQVRFYPSRAVEMIPNQEERRSRRIE